MGSRITITSLHIVGNLECCLGDKTITTDKPSKLTVNGSTLTISIKYNQINHVSIGSMKINSMGRNVAINGLTIDGNHVESEDCTAIQIDGKSYLGYGTEDCTLNSKPDPDYKRKHSHNYHFSLKNIDMQGGTYTLSQDHVCLTTPLQITLSNSAKFAFTGVLNLVSSASLAPGSETELGSSTPPITSITSITSITQTPFPFVRFTASGSSDAVLNSLFSDECIFTLSSSSRVKINDVKGKGVSLHASSGSTFDLREAECSHFNLITSSSSNGNLYKLVGQELKLTTSESSTIELVDSQLNIIEINGSSSSKLSLGYVISRTVNFYISDASLVDYFASQVNYLTINAQSSSLVRMIELSTLESINCLATGASTCQFSKLSTKKYSQAVMGSSRIILFQVIATTSEITAKSFSSIDAQKSSLGICSLSSSRDAIIRGLEG